MKRQADDFGMYAKNPQRLTKFFENYEKQELEAVKVLVEIEKENPRAWIDNPEEVFKILHSSAVKNGVKHLEKFNNMLKLLQEIISREIYERDTKNYQTKLDRLGFGGREWKMLHNIFKATSLYVDKNLDDSSMKMLSKQISAELDDITGDVNELLGVFSGKAEFDRETVADLSKKTKLLGGTLKKFYTKEKTMEAKEKIDNR